MSSILIVKDFTKLESSIHESTYELLMHIALLETHIDHGMMELELRKRAAIKAQKEMNSACTDHSKLDETHDFDYPAEMEANIGIDTLGLILGTIRRLQALLTPRYIAALTCAGLIAPAAAMEQLAVGRSIPVMEIVRPHHIPTIALGTCTGMLLLCGGYMIGAAKSLIAPLMGITSVLWFMLRNDAAVSPSLAWAIFGAWAIFTLMYFSLQCRRVTYDKIYMLASLAFAGVCLCIVASVQKSSIQGGLVTAVPPCTSFAAYAVAFAFPSNPRGMQQPTLV